MIGWVRCWASWLARDESHIVRSGSSVETRWDSSETLTLAEDNDMGSASRVSGKIEFDSVLLCLSLPLAYKFYPSKAPSLQSWFPMSSDGLQLITRFKTACSTFDINAPDSFSALCETLDALAGDLGKNIDARSVHLELEIRSLMLLSRLQNTIGRRGCLD